MLDDGAGRSVTMDNFNNGILIGATGPAGIDPFSSSMLTVDGLGTGGISPALTSPRGVLFAPMSTAQRNLIVNPANGLLVYNTTTNTYDVFAGGSWGAISGWSLVGNSLPVGGGGTGLGQNFLGSLNAQDVVIATNVGAPGSGVGERMRITSAGQVGFSAMNSPFTPATDFNVDGTAGTANVRLNSLGGAPLLVPALNLAADGITIAGGMGDLLKYDVATVVGSVAWLRTGNNIVDGNNLFGTTAGSATTDVQMVTNGLPVMYLDGATQFVGVGNSTPAYTLDVTGTLASSGNSDIGTDPLTNNTFGNNGAGTNQIGDGAQFNYVGDNATNFNSFGYNAVLNDFGGASAIFAQSNTYGQNDGAFGVFNGIGINQAGLFVTNEIGTDNNAGVVLNDIGNNNGGGTVTNNIGAIGATSNNIGSGTLSTNTIQGTTNINVGVNSNTDINTAGTGAVGIGNSNSVTINSSANDVTVNTDAGTTANDLVLTGIDAPDANFDILTINNAGDVNAVGRATGTALTQQGVSFDNEASGTRIRMGSLTAGNGAALYPFLANRFVNLDAFTVSFNRGAATDNMLSLNGATDVVTIEGTTNVNVSHNTATNINTGTSTGAVAIGNFANAAGGVTISANTNDVTINTTNGAGSDLVLTGIELVNPIAGNLLWLTGANEVRQSAPNTNANQGLTWQLEVVDPAVRVRLGARETPTDPLGTNALLENRVVYLGGLRLNFSDNTGASFLSLNDAANTTQLGVAGGTANTVTGTTNTMTATVNNVLGAGAQNQLTGATGNSVTATTGNNAIAATTGTNALTAGTSNTMNAPTNTVTATGAGGNDIIATTADNVITGQTGNTMTATTGNNAIAATAGTNALTAGTSNTMNAPANVMQATGAGGNTINSTAAGNNLIQTTGTGANVLSSITSTSITSATQTAITSNAGNTTITTNGGDLILDVDGAAGDIIMNIVDAAVPANTDRSLFLNAANEVNTRTFSSLADQGLQYDATAFMLGANANGTNPITSNRFVSTTTGTLTFTNGAANNYIAIGTSAANTLALGNAANNFSITSNQLNVAATGAISDAGGDVEFVDNVVPFVDNAFSLGTDAVRWSNGYFNGASVHIGPTGGQAGNTELAAGYAANVGTLNVDGGLAELSIDRTVSNLISFNPNGLGAAEATIGVTGLTLNTAGGTDLLLSESGLDRSSGANETFLFNNSGVGRLDVSHKGHVFPSATGLYDLGSPALVWNNVYANNLFLPPMTPGSVLFIGAGGQMTQDNANFFWDATNTRLGVGTNAPTDDLDVNGTSRFRNAGTFDNTMTTTGTHTANGASLLNGTVTINGQLNINNLVADAAPFRNFIPVLQSSSGAGGAVETRPLDELPFQGYGRVQMAATAANYNLTVGTDYVLICNNGAAIAVNLPVAAANQGRTFIIKSRGAGNVNITPAGGSLIDGVAGAHTIVGGGNAVRTVVCDGTDWYIIAN